MEYANKEKTMEVVEEDDQQVLVFFFMKVLKHLVHTKPFAFDIQF
jgi:hypothetical protein